MIRGLVSRQTVWKTAIATVLAVALVAGLAIALPLLTKQSPEALAAEIAKNSPEVQAALGVEEVEVVRVIVGVGDKPTVIIYRGETGQYVLATVDLETAEVTDVTVVSMPTRELTEAEKEEAIAIAKAYPRIKELLDQGASIDRVTPIIFMNVFYYLAIHEGYEVPLDVESRPPIYKGAYISLRLEDRTWSVFIDLEGKKVIRLHIDKDTQ